MQVRFSKSRRIQRRSEGGAIVSRFGSMTSIIRLAVMVLLTAALTPIPAPARPRKCDASAMQLLNHAVFLADLYNWGAAGPDFAEAEKLFSAAGDQRNALYARLGALRSSAERLNLPATSAQLAQELNTNPFLRTDKPLRMFCLTVKGDIDGEMNAGAMRDDWEQVESLARELGNTKWQYRASAQLGLAAFYQGDLATASRNVGRALAEAKISDDKGAEIRYLTYLGIGLVYSRMYAQALSYFDHALEIAEATPDAGYPFVTEESRLQALIGLRELDAAQLLDAEILTRVLQAHRRSQEAQALILASSIAEARNDHTTALAALKQALAISKPAGYLRQVAQEQSQLAELYRKLGNLPKAERFAALAVASTQSSGSIWSVPGRLQTLAEIKASEGDYAHANRIYDRAEAFIDASVGGASAVLDKTAFIKASSRLYSQHFCLIAQHFNNPAKALSIIEQVRGRITTDLLMAGSRTPVKAEIDERAISALRLKLMTSRSTAEVRSIRNQIFMAEQARWVTPHLSILKARSRETFGITRIRSSLDASTVLLEYVTAEPQSYCLVIARAHARIVPLAGNDRINELVAAYLKAVKAKQSAYKEGRQLYDVLLQPIPEIQRKEILVVVRDGPLYLLSFDGLVSASGRYVVEAHTVVYTPSATAYYLLAQQAQRPRTFSHQLLAVGGIPYNDAELKRASLTRGYDANDLSLLPGSKQEVLAAAAAIPDPATPF